MISRQIIDYLEQHSNIKLPNSGIIAGQSVAEAYFRVNNIDIHTRIKDIDIFCLDYIPEKNSTEINVKFFNTEFSLEYSEYQLLVNSVNNDYHIHRVKEEDIFNYIYISNYSKNKKLLHTIIDRFDINSVQIGIDLKTKEIYMSSYFIDFVKNRQLQIVNFHSFPSSLLRLIDKKLHSTNTYLNLDFEISYGLPTYIYKTKKGTFILDKKYDKIFNNPESKPYLDIFNHYFKLDSISFSNKIQEPYELDIKEDNHYKIVIDQSYYYSKAFFLYFKEYCDVYNLDINIVDFLLRDYIDINILNKYNLNYKKIKTKNLIEFNFFYTNQDVLSYFINNIDIQNILIPVSFKGLHFTIFEIVNLKKVEVKNFYSINKNLDNYIKLVSFNDKKTLDFLYNLKNKPISDFKVLNLKTFINFVIKFNEYDYIHYKSYKLNTIFSHYELFLKLYLFLKEDFKDPKDFFEHCYNFFKLFKNEYLFLIGVLETEKIKISLLKNIFLNLDINPLIKNYENKLIKQKVIIPHSYLIYKDYTIKQIYDSLNLKYIGYTMKHCVGGHYQNLKRNEFFYFDIFDKDKIRMTLQIQVIKQKDDIFIKLIQMKLKQNKEPSKENFKDIYCFLTQLKEYFVKLKVDYPDF